MILPWDQTGGWGLPEQPPWQRDASPHCTEMTSKSYFIETSSGGSGSNGYRRQTNKAQTLHFKEQYGIYLHLNYQHGYKETPSACDVLANLTSCYIIRPQSSLEVTFSDLWALRSMMHAGKCQAKRRDLSHEFRRPPAAFRPGAWIICDVSARIWNVGISCARARFCAAH